MTGADDQFAGSDVVPVENERQLDKGEAIPEYAIVIPGSRPASNDWAREQGLSMSCALIVKYRDEQSDASLLLEEVLR